MALERTDRGEAGMLVPRAERGQLRRHVGLCVLTTFLSVLTAPPARAADAVLFADRVELTAGTAFEIAVTFLNATSSPRDVRVPSPLHVRVETPDAVTTLQLQSSSSAVGAEGTMRLEVDEARTIRFAGTLPTGLSGTVMLTALSLQANPLLLQVVAEPRPAESVAVLDEDSTTTPVTPKPPPPALAFYGPNYFLVGGDGGLNAKFQLGFQFRLFDNRGPLASRFPALHDLYFGYAQTSLWDLHEASSPFRDSSYRPEPVLRQLRSGPVQERTVALRPGGRAGA